MDLTLEPGPLQLLDVAAFEAVFHAPRETPAAAEPDAAAVTLAQYADALDVMHADMLENAGADSDRDDISELDAIAASANALAEGNAPEADPDIAAAMAELDGELDGALADLAGEVDRGTPGPWIRPRGDDDFEKFDPGQQDGRYEF